MTSSHSPAVTYLAQLTKHKYMIREQWRKDAGNLLDAHQLAFSTVVNMVRRNTAKKFETQKASMEGRMSLTAQFIYGIDICESAISEGFYSQAAALLKQEMETIEAINEHKTGTRREKITPKMKILKGFGRVYSQYNEFSHVSVKDIAKIIVCFDDGNLIGPSILPLYNKEIAIPFYGMHVFFIIVIAKQIESIFIDLFDDKMNEDEIKFLTIAIEILKKEDIIKTPQL